jgi:hypothetical protein
LQVENVLHALKNESSQKKAIFDLKVQLQDASFAEAFIAKDGIKAITKLITDSTGNFEKCLKLSAISVVFIKIEFM